jgi:hypothetical protein
MEHQLLEGKKILSLHGLPFPLWTISGMPLEESQHETLMEDSQ